LDYGNFIEIEQQSQGSPQAPPGYIPQHQLIRERKELHEQMQQLSFRMQQQEQRLEQQVAINQANMDGLRREVNDKHSQVLDKFDLLFARLDRQEGPASESGRSDQHSAASSSSSSSSASTPAFMNAAAGFTPAVGLARVGSLRPAATFNADSRENAKAFLSRMEDFFMRVEHAEGRSMSAVEKSLAAIDQLKGKAAPEWWLKLKEASGGVAPAWEVFRKELLSAFPPPLQSAVEAAFSKLQQRDGEKLREYVTRVRELDLQLPLSQLGHHARVTAFFTGLKFRQAQLEVSRAQLQREDDATQPDLTLAEAIRIAEQADQLFTSTNPPTGGGGRGGPGRGQQQQQGRGGRLNAMQGRGSGGRGNPQQQQQQQQQPQQQPQQGADTRVCYKCGQKGHVQAKCPNQSSQE
jgi:hypothetical protein